MVNPEILRYGSWPAGGSHRKIYGGPLPACSVRYNGGMQLTHTPPNADSLRPRHVGALPPQTVASAAEALTLIAADAAATAHVAAKARDHLRAATVAACELYRMPEAEAARYAGVARTTVRAWRRDARAATAVRHTPPGRCPDCGEHGERRGHMECQYPTDD